MNRTKKQLIICPICGNPINTTKKTGRPKQYHDKCRQLLTAINLLENRLIDFKKMKAAKTRRQQIRKNILSILNTGLN